MKAYMRDILADAKSNHYAVPATNFIDFLTAKTYANVSEELNAPLILAFAQAHSEWLSLEEAALIGKYFQEKTTTPIVLHLDHGQDFDFIKRAIKLGFNSVMIDASLEPFGRNVERTREIIDYAHRFGVDVEAEIGFVGANENLENHQVVESVYTTVNEAVDFVNKTHVDTLAISIGTAHGIYKGIPNINFERLHDIEQSVSIPLVLHGGSSSGDENLARCAREGISKINLFSDLINAGYQGKNSQEVVDYPTLNNEVQKQVAEMLRHYYRVFGVK